MPRAVSRRRSNAQQPPPEAEAPPSPPPAPPPDEGGDWRLDLAYNQQFTAREEVHEQYLRDLAARSDGGWRMRCWRCDRPAVRFGIVQLAVGPVGLAECERCGAWCVY